MGWMPRHPHGPSRQASAWSGRLRSTVVSRGFSAPAVVIRTCCPVLRGRAEACSLNFSCWYVERSGAGAGPIAQLARARA
jgi:hypothetical protein